MSQLLKGFGSPNYTELAILVTVGVLCVVLIATVAMIFLGADLGEIILSLLPPLRPPIATGSISDPASTSTSGAVGMPLRFDATGSTDGDGTITSYAWGFGDGTTGSGVSVEHVYQIPGNYKVTLTVTDDGGLTDTATFEVEITPVSPNQPPKAIIIRATSELLGEGLTLDGAGSSVSAVGASLGQDEYPKSDDQ